MSENHVCVVTEIEGSLGWRFDCKECGRSTGWHRYHLAAKQSWDEALSATGREASVEATEEDLEAIFVENQKPFQTMAEFARFLLNHPRLTISISRRPA